MNTAVSHVSQSKPRIRERQRLFCELGFAASKRCKRSSARSTQLFKYFAKCRGRRLIKFMRGTTCYFAKTNPGERTQTLSELFPIELPVSLLKKQIIRIVLFQKGEGEGRHILRVFSVLSRGHLPTNTTNTIKKSRRTTRPSSRLGRVVCHA